jgi:hypothetical protein
VTESGIALSFFCHPITLRVVEILRAHEEPERN